MTELLTLLKERQSSRTSFDVNRRIAKEDLLKILEAGSWAPTAHNMQNFEAMVVDNPKIIGQIAEMEFPVSKEFIKENFQQLSFSEDELRRKGTGVLAFMFPKSWLNPDTLPGEEANEGIDAGTERHHQMLSCPLLVMLLYNPSKRAPASEGDFLGIMSLGCVLENMWLMASSLGIGMHIVSALSSDAVERKIKGLLAIPEHLKIAISFRLGYPAGPSKYLRVRRQVKDFLHMNHYGKSQYPSA